MKNNNGFTLIEVVLGVALMTIITVMIAGFLYTAATATQKNMSISASRESVIGSMDAKVLGSIADTEVPNGVWVLSKGGATLKSINGVIDSDASYNAKAFRTEKATGTTETPTTETSTEPTTAPVSEDSTESTTGAYEKTWNDHKSGNGYVITDSVVILDSLSTGANQNILIDCAGGKKIDIVLKQPLTIGGGSGIFVNDDNGNGRVRIFLDGAGTFTLDAGWANNWGVYPLKGSIPLTSCSYSDSGVYVDYSKTINLYLFATGNNKIAINNSSSFPGYIIAPFADVFISVWHEYNYAADGTEIPVTAANYPVIHGMLVCKDLSLNSTVNNGYFIKYNPPVEAAYMDALSDVFVYS